MAMNPIIPIPYRLHNIAHFKDRILTKYRRIQTLHRLHKRWQPRSLCTNQTWKMVFSTKKGCWPKKKNDKLSISFDSKWLIIRTSKYIPKRLFFAIKLMLSQGINKTLMEQILLAVYCTRDWTYSHDIHFFLPIIMFFKCNTCCG